MTVSLPISLSLKAGQLTLGLDRDAKCLKDVFRAFLVKDITLMCSVKPAVIEPFRIVPEEQRVQFRNPTFNLNFTALENPGSEF